MHRAGSKFTENYVLNKKSDPEIALYFNIFRLSRQFAPAAQESEFGFSQFKASEKDCAENDIT